MKLKLNQLLAREASVKSKSNEAITALYHAAQKPALFNGFLKRYQPKAEEGEKFPDEKQKVQYTANGVVEEVTKLVRELYEVEAAKNYSNCDAKADITVDGKILATGVPATFLLYLSKELDSLRTIVATLPTLSEDEDWIADASQLGLYKTAATQQIKTKKVQKALVMYPHSDKHPAQTQLITEDETVGSWETVKVSGAFVPANKKKLLAKIDRLADAVKAAREAANMVTAVEPNIGNVLVDWLVS